MFYNSILSQHQLTVEKLSKPTQALIEKYNQTQTYITETEGKLNEAQTDRSKQRLTSELEKFKTYLADLEAQITKKIEQFAKNKDVYAANAARMKAAKHKKKSSTQAASTPASTPPAAQGAVIEPLPAEEPITATPPEKKSKSGIGWLLFGIGAVAAAVIGVNIYKNRD